MTSLVSFHRKHDKNNGTHEFSHGQVGVENGTAALSEVLPHVTGLDLDNLSIGDEGITALAQHALPQLPSLTKLSLSGNFISVEGATALAQVLPQLSQLEVLDLSNNSVGNDGLKALVRVLPQSPQLSDLHLSHNSIGDEGIMALARVLPHLPHLTYLELRNNSISHDGVAALARSSYDGNKGYYRAGRVMNGESSQTIPTEICLFGCSLEEPLLVILRAMELD